MVPPKPPRAVPQPPLKRALATGAGTAEEDHSKQKGHQDDAGEEEEQRAQAGTGGSSRGLVHAGLVWVCLQLLSVQAACWQREGKLE